MGCVRGGQADAAHEDVKAESECMLGLGKVARKVFGTPNDRKVKATRPLVEKVNALEAEFEKLSDAQLIEKTAEFKARISNGEALDDLLPEAFANCREAAKRALGLRAFDVQLMGGIFLHQGNISEMKTGEGKTLVATMRKNGAYTALVSGGFTTFTSKIADMLGFHENRANILETENGKLTGTVRKPILGAEAKVEALHDICEQHGFSPEDFIAVGDGAHDLPMLKIAGTGVALHAKPSVAAQSNIKIDHGDLTSLLYIQGYKKSDFHDG